MRNRINLSSIRSIPLNNFFHPLPLSFLIKKVSNGIQYKNYWRIFSSFLLFKSALLCKKIIEKHFWLIRQLFQRLSGGKSFSFFLSVDFPPLKVKRAKRFGIKIFRITHCVQQLILFGRESVKLELVIFHVLLLAFFFATLLRCQFSRYLALKAVEKEKIELWLKVLLLDLMLISESFETNCLIGYCAIVSQSNLNPILPKSEISIQGVWKYFQ